MFEDKPNKPKGPEANPPNGAIRKDDQTVHQPGIIFRALGSKVSSEDLLRRIKEETQEK